MNRSTHATGLPRLARLPIAGLALALVFLGEAWSKPKSKKRGSDLVEDSLQTLVALEPENPSHWLQLGELAVKNGQTDLATGYFDEAIKLSGRDGQTILQVGGVWLTHGKVKASLPYLMPNLIHLDSAQLHLLQAGLEKEKMPSVQLIVLRHLANRTPAFHPMGRKAVILAFRLGDYTLCQGILRRALGQLDYESARNLLLVNFFLGTAVDEKSIKSIQERFPHGEIASLAALNHAQGGRWREVRAFLSKHAKSPSYRDYYNLASGMEAASADRPEEAADYYEEALKTPWDRLRAAVYADLYRLYSTTGNKFKSDQIWDTMKEDYQDKDPDLLEVMARQLISRGYEKQGRYFYRVVLRKRPSSAHALDALWDDLVDREDDKSLMESINAVLFKDQFSCEGNTLAMEFHYRRQNDREVLPYARNATMYCYDTVEPYYVLGSTFLKMSKPDEARTYFATYIRKGGDANKVPLNLR
jgi:tetratricopeptide (TPR) repeat protein